MDFKTRLKKLREEKGLTHKEIADHLGVNYNTVGNYERGSRQPDLETAKKLSNFFGVSVDFLLGNTNERNSTETAKYSSLTKSQKRMIETYERLSASDDPNAQRIKDTIDRLLGISGQEDDK